MILRLGLLARESTILRSKDGTLEGPASTSKPCHIFLPLGEIEDCFLAGDPGTPELEGVLGGGVDIIVSMSGESLFFGVLIVTDAIWSTTVESLIFLL